MGVHAVVLCRRRRGVQQQPAARLACSGSGRSGHDRRRVPAVHPVYLQPLPARGQPAGKRARAQSGVAGSRFGVSPAIPLPRLCRLLRRLRLRRRRVDRGQGRCRLGPLGAALDAGILVRADHRNRDGILVGVLHVGLGRLVVLGPGGKRLFHAVAGRNGADPLVHRRGEARHAEDLDHSPGDRHLFPFARWHLPGALRRADLGACLRHRPGSRHLYSAASSGRHRRLAGAVRRACAQATRRRSVRAGLAGGCARPQQSAAVLRLRHCLPRHALPAVPRRDGWAETVRGISVLQPHVRSPDGADDPRRRHRPHARLEARRSTRRPATTMGRVHRCGPRHSGNLLRHLRRSGSRGARHRHRRLARRRRRHRMGGTGGPVPHLAGR